jgi:hypothetical protein
MHAYAGAVEELPAGHGQGTCIPVRNKAYHGGRVGAPAHVAQHDVHAVGQREGADGLAPAARAHLVGLGL